MAFPSPYKTVPYPTRWASLPLPQPITLLDDCTFEQFYKSAGRYQETRLTYSHSMVKGNIFINFGKLKKKAAFSPHCKDETTQPITAFSFNILHS